MKNRKFKAQQPIIVFGPARSGTSLITGLLHIGGAWCGETALGNWRNLLGFFENKQMALAIYAARKAGNDFMEAIYDEMIKQGYCGGQWTVKLFHTQIKEWIANFDPFWVFVHRSFKAIRNSRYYDKRATHPTEEEKHAIKVNTAKTRSLIADWRRYREQITQNTKRYFDIIPQKIIIGDHSQLCDLYKATGLIYYKDLVNHFVVPDHWHMKG